MNKLILAALCTGAVLVSCNTKNSSENPFFTEWDTPFGIPPFDKIQPEHYRPAYDEAMAREKADIDAIVKNNEAPTFSNVILAYDNSGEMLERVGSTFSCVSGSDMTPELEAIQAEMAPVLTRHRNDIGLNAELFAKVKAVYDQRDVLCPDSLSVRLTEKTYKNFERSGANLSPDDKAKLRVIDETLSTLSTNFGRNLRVENGAFAMIIEDSADLDGLPQSIVDAAAKEAEARGIKNSWVFTLDKPSMIPFLQYSNKSNLRETLYKGYLERCNNNNEYDNKTTLDSIVNLRLERANLLGFPNYAAFVLDRNMASQPEAVYALLGELWTPALGRAKGELAEMVAIKGDTNFNSWDWWYYAEKLRQSKYDLNEEELRPYFPLNGVREGIFTLTNKLYGVTYKPLPNVPMYNTENQVFEVSDKDGSHLGVLFLDFHPRPGKRVGAWCTTFRGQSYTGGQRVAPIVSIVCNFSKPTGDTPALLNLDEVETFFHEFGHGLHQLFAMVPYKGLGGVERDFVELPSQIMENWAMQPQMLNLYAKHYKTGEVIPADLVEKIQQSALFNQGFSTIEYLAASLLDMDYHTITTPGSLDVMAFEQASMDRVGAISQIEPRYRSPYFRHIFSGGYASGYYSYIWAEVLDADAFQAFVDSGDLFNPAIASAFRTQILSRGGSADGNTLYRNFRAAEPSKEPLLVRRGLK